jgi:hypothetical protein
LVISTPDQVTNSICLVPDIPWDMKLRVFVSQNEVAEGTILFGYFNDLLTGKVEAVCLNMKMKTLQAARRS